jgi:hypothetical protein
MISTVKLHKPLGLTLTLHCRDTEAAERIGLWMLVNTDFCRADIQEQHGTGRPFIRNTHRKA